MNKKITFEEWVDTFLQGIWQALCWVGRVFNPKYKTKFWRVVWSVIAVCVVAFTCMMGYAFYEEFCDREVRYAQYDYELGDYVYFHNTRDDKGYVYTLKGNKKVKTVKGVNWVVCSGDSLAVFAQKGKRGYLNRYTGRVAIPAEYDAAWIFTDGVAGVCRDDSVWFVDRTNAPINDKKFKRTPDHDYCYHGGYVAIPAGRKTGFVTRTGDWAGELYDRVEIMPRNMWLVCRNDSMGVLSDQLDCVVPVEHKWLYVGPCDGIAAVNFDNVQKLYDYDGSIINDFVIDGVGKLDYASDEFDDEGCRIPKAADVDSYYVNNRYGLLGKDGRPITVAKYNDIRALSANTFECEYGEGFRSVSEIVNSKGEVVSRHP